MIQLSIPNPCQKKWSGLTPVVGGSFCTSCQKQVIDFTSLSDKEILTYLSGARGKVCGRFRTEQLNKQYEVKESMRIRPGISLIKAGVMAVFMMLMSRPALAQEKVRQKTEVVQEKRLTKSIAIEDENYWIEGFIQDKYDQSAMPGVNVALQGTTHGTTSDVNGYFRFPVRVKKNDVLIVSFIGYMTELYKVPAAGENTIILKLSMDVEVLGEVAVDGLYSPKTTLWSKIRNWF